MRPASPSSVAEKNSVWRSRGHLATIRSTAGRKPMSSMRSASSSTSVLHVGEREGAAGEQVLEPAGGGDEDVRALRVAGLLLEADAAVDGGHAQAAGARQRAQLVDDLAGQLARGGEDERRRAARVGRDAVDQRGAEGERLAGAGRRLGEHVAAGQHVGDDELLDGEGGVHAAIAQGGGDRTGYAEIGEGLWT